MAKPSAHKSNTDKKHRFLSELERLGQVKAAASCIDVNRRTIYDWRDQDKSFADAWDQALIAFEEDTVGVYETEVKERALNREDKYSHILLMFALKKLRPEYRENYKQELTVRNENVQEFSFSKDEMNKAIEILQRATGKSSEQTTEES